jgi:hypothetical protein
MFKRQIQQLQRLALVLAMGGSSMAHSIEEPTYETVEKLGQVEIRHYEPVIQAVTTLNSKRSSGSGFQRLAGFIFGGNQQEQSIAMTAPVQETLGVAEPEMAFTMPREYAMEDLPRPNSASVRLNEVPGRTVAVIRFSGWATEGKINRMRSKLDQVLNQHEIPVTGEWSLNQYNPPWTPPFLRRNEIWVEVEWEALSGHGELAAAH